MVPPRSSALLAQGDPLQDPRAFRRCLGQFATGVTVITTRHGDVNAGVTANSFSSLSLDPPLILWSIARTSRSYATFMAASHFVVNVLSAEQIDVSQTFASSETDKFAKVDWRPGHCGVPVLNAVTGYFECRRETLYEGGDHVIIVGRVEHFAQFQGQSLLFVQGRYGIAEDHPDLKVPGAGATQTEVADNDRSLMGLLFRAYHYTAENFEEHRKAEALTVGQARALSGLYENASMDMDDLARRMYLGVRDAEDAVADLVARGDALRGLDQRFSLTAMGRERREAINRRVAEFEAELLADMPEIEIADARRFLHRLIDKRKIRDGA